MERLTVRLALFSPLMLLSICRMVTIASLVWICYRGTLSNHRKLTRKNALFCARRTAMWPTNMGVTGGENEGPEQPRLSDDQRTAVAHRRQVERPCRLHAR